jgi:acetylglutamate kinase
MVKVQKNYNLAWCNPSSKDDNTKHSSASGIKDIALIKKVLQKVNLIRDQIIVIKLSDIVISDNNLLNNFADNIFLLQNAGARIVIVHDYENIVKRKLAEFSGIHETEYSRFRKDKLSDLAEMIISGRINRDIVSKLCEYSIQAIGLSGKDNQSITATKCNGSSNFFEGKITSINPEAFIINDENSIVSVISPVAYDETSKTILLDANSLAAAIASAIGADHLIIMSDKHDLTENQIKLSEYSEMQHFIKNRSITSDSPEIIAAEYAMQNAGCLTHFCDAKIQDILLLKMFS